MGGRETENWEKGDASASAGENDKQANHMNDTKVPGKKTRQVKMSSNKAKRNDFVLTIFRWTPKKVYFYTT